MFGRFHTFFYPMLTIALAFGPMYARCSEEVLLTTSGYGFLMWDGIKHDKPGIWPYYYLSDAKHINDMIYPNFRISDAENKVTQKKYKLYTQLVVQQKNKYLQAHVVFKNRSKISYFVHLSGILSPRNAVSHPLCNNAFSITTGGTLLNFLLVPCRYYSEDEPDNWREVMANSDYNFTINLNEAYAFPPGYRRYNIGSLEYNVVTEKWLREQYFFNLMFSIFEWELSCKTRKNTSYIKHEKNVCKIKDSTLRSFLYFHGFEGSNENEHFSIRTNQVVIYANGETLKPFYDNQY